jgi:hypothetical protein
MTSYFLKAGKTFRVSSKEAMDLHERLPGGNYVIKEDVHGNLYLETIEDFEFKGKRYGDNERNTDRILNTFDKRNTSTGVMLTGEKGSGKSLLAKMISITAQQNSDIPTIVINAPWHGDKFNSFIQSIEQPCIVLFDEFEKVYDSEQQEQILTLLDGVFPSKKLFVLTCNDKWRVDSHMRNRPGRIFYMLEFKGLSEDFIREYCQDNLSNLTHVDRICSIASLFSQFNFDMLKALVEEMNRYDEAPEDAMRMLNAKPEFDAGKVKYTATIQVEGDTVAPDNFNSSWIGNPLNDSVRIDYRVDLPGTPEDGDDYEYRTASVSTSDLKKIDPQAGKFVFVSLGGTVVTLQRVKESSFNLYDAL